MAYLLLGRILVDKPEEKERELEARFIQRAVKRGQEKTLGRCLNKNSRLEGNRPFDAIHGRVCETKNLKKQCAYMVKGQKSSA